MVCSTCKTSCECEITKHPYREQARKIKDSVLGVFNKQAKRANRVFWFFKMLQKIKNFLVDMKYWIVEHYLAIGIVLILTPIVLSFAHCAMKIDQDQAKQRDLIAQYNADGKVLRCWVRHTHYMQVPKTFTFAGQSISIRLADSNDQKEVGEAAKLLGIEDVNSCMKE